MLMDRWIYIYMCMYVKIHINRKIARDVSHWSKDDFGSSLPKNDFGPKDDDLMGMGIKDWASWLDKHFPTYNQLIHCISSKSKKYCATEESRKWTLTFDFFKICWMFSQQTGPKIAIAVSGSWEWSFSPFASGGLWFRQASWPPGSVGVLMSQDVFCILKDAYILFIWMQIKEKKCVYINYLHVCLSIVYVSNVYMYAFTFAPWARRSCVSWNLQFAYVHVCFVLLRTLNIDMSPNFGTIFVYTQSCFFSYHFCGASSRLRTVSQDFMAQCIRALLMLRNKGLKML